MQLDDASAIVVRVVPSGVVDHVGGPGVVGDGVGIEVLAIPFFDVTEDGDGAVLLSD